MSEVQLRMLIILVNNGSIDIENIKNDEYKVEVERRINEQQD